MYAKNVAPYVFVIDTDQYAGNFERQLCAYLTGILGDCGVGILYAEMYNIFLEDSEIAVNPFFDLMLQLSDEHGCKRPCSIWPTPGFVNDGYGEHFKMGSLEAKELKKQYPAYLSVALFFHEKPDEELICLLKKRTEMFLKLEHPKLRGFAIPEDLKILNFRLIKQHIVQEEINI